MAAAGMDHSQLYVDYDDEDQVGVREGIQRHRQCQCTRQMFFTFIHLFGSRNLDLRYLLLIRARALPSTPLKT